MTCPGRFSATVLVKMDRIDGKNSSPSSGSIQLLPNSCAAHCSFWVHSALLLCHSATSNSFFFIFTQIYLSLGIDVQTGKPKLLHGGSGTWHTCEQVTQAKWKLWDIVTRTVVPWLPAECPGTWKACQQAYILCHVVGLRQGKFVIRCALLCARLVLMFWVLFSKLLASDRLIPPPRAIYTHGK